MEITSQLDFAATPDQVMSMMMDADWLSNLATRSQATSSTVNVNGNHTTIQMELTTPSKAAAVAGSKLNLVQSIIWAEPNASGERDGRMTIDVKGLPAQFIGTAKVREGGKGCTVDYCGQLMVNLPFVGKKLAEAAAPYMVKVIEIQQELGDEYLADQ